MNGVKEVIVDLVLLCVYVVLRRDENFTINLNVVHAGLFGLVSLADCPTAGRVSHLRRVSASPKKPACSNQ